jgi:hypothetical protein
METFVAERCQRRNLIGGKTPEEFVGQLARPRKVMLMVKAGAPVDAMIEQFAPLYFECPVTLHLVLGNHDIASYWIDEADVKESFQINVNRARAAWIRNIPSFQNGTYYSRDYAVGETSYRFLFLDNGYSLKDGSVLDPHQLDWLAHELESAAENPVVIFMHKYLRVADLDGDGRYFAAGNTVTIDSTRCSKGFYRLLDEYQNIKLLLVGHGHKNITETVYFPSGNRVVQTETAAFAADPANWRMIKFAQDAIQISPCGADRKRTVIKIRDE